MASGATGDLVLKVVLDASEADRQLDRLLRKAGKLGAVPGGAAAVSTAPATQSSSGTRAPAGGGAPPTPPGFIPPSVTSAEQRRQERAIAYHRQLVAQNSEQARGRDLIQESQAAMSNMSRKVGNPFMVLSEMSGAVSGTRAIRIEIQKSAEALRNAQREARRYRDELRAAEAAYGADHDITKQARARSAAADANLAGAETSVVAANKKASGIGFMAKAGVDFFAQNLMAGALFGLIFPASQAIVQAGLDIAAQLATNIIDPTKRAREALGTFADKLAGADIDSFLRQAAIVKGSPLSVFAQEVKVVKTGADQLSQFGETISTYGIAGGKADALAEGAVKDFLAGLKDNFYSGGIDINGGREFASASERVQNMDGPTALMTVADGVKKLVSNNDSPAIRDATNRAVDLASQDSQNDPRSFLFRGERTADNFFYYLEKRLKEPSFLAAMKIGGEQTVVKNAAAGITAGAPASSITQDIVDLANKNYGIESKTLLTKAATQGLSQKELERLRWVLALNEDALALARERAKAEEDVAMAQKKQADAAGRAAKSLMSTLSDQFDRVADMKARLKDYVQQRALLTNNDRSGDLTKNQRALVKDTIKLTAAQKLLADYQKKLSAQDLNKQLSQAKADVARASVATPGMSPYELAASILEAKQREKDVQEQVAEQRKMTQLQDRVAIASEKVAADQRAIQLENIDKNIAELNGKLDPAANAQAMAYSIANALAGLTISMDGETVSRKVEPGVTKIQALKGYYEIR